MNLIFLSSAPVVIILVYVYIRDKYEHEPMGLLLKTLLAGALTVIPVMIVNSGIEGYRIHFRGYAQVAFIAFIVAGLVEEFFKFTALYLLIWKTGNSTNVSTGSFMQCLFHSVLRWSRTSCMFSLMVNRQVTPGLLRLFLRMHYSV